MVRDEVLQSLIPTSMRSEDDTPVEPLHQLFDDVQSINNRLDGMRFPLPSMNQLNRLSVETEVQLLKQSRPTHEAVASHFVRTNKTVKYLKSLLSLAPDETEDMVGARETSKDIDIVNRDRIGALHSLFVARISELKQELETHTATAATTADIQTLTERISKAEEALKGFQLENESEAEEGASKPAQKRNRGGKN
eukprot:gb/GEZN01009962.1/.p1 GENE.gb/GEZN01009962.1/~~gb/GEZN01009962.1/.p1  ORF type:complete len:195 (-),score=34.91 gb/GEZN01009962.1/:144-728(-)